MIRITASNITSPLGFTTAENYAAVKAGRSALTVDAGRGLFKGPYCSAHFTPAQLEELTVEGFTLYESIIIHSVREALSHTDADPASPRTILILSTTKANVEALSTSPETDGDYRDAGVSARKVARYLGITTEPMVVCNACISGITGQILADRLLGTGCYDTAIVCGADCVTDFLVAVFEAFKAVSRTPCRPYDLERTGLNIGEAAATLILQRPSDSDPEGTWRLVNGYLNNDAYHVSAPDPTGDGIIRVINHTADAAQKAALTTLAAHGTGTMFNDQMESKAFVAAGLSGVPITALKPFFGHTMGAAGVLEVIIAMCALDDGVILPVRGFEEYGVSGKINLSTTPRPASGKTFLKVISGFGSCNGAALYDTRPVDIPPVRELATYSPVRRVRITPEAASLDDVDITPEGKGVALLNALYKARIGDNLRFYKMDPFSRLTYLAAGLLLQELPADTDPESVAVVLFNKTASDLADRAHLKTFMPPAEYYPSPAVCIFTLPNVVLGEIAVRYRVKGETTFLILPEKVEPLMHQVVASTLAFSDCKILLTGWVDCAGEDEFEADLQIITK